MRHNEVNKCDLNGLKANDLISDTVNNCDCLNAPLNASQEDKIKVTDKELLEQYKAVGLTPKQCEYMLKQLQGNCWCCEHGKKYYPNGNIFKNTNLTVCKLKVQEETIAATRNENCQYWKIKSVDNS